MRARMINFGTSWWSVHSCNLDDSYCFHRRAAWFNSAGLKDGGRLCLCWVCPGHIGFNQNSGLQPEYPLRSIGKAFLCSGPNRLHVRSHLLFIRSLYRTEPDLYLAAVTDASNGRISFSCPAWRSAGVEPISVSLRGIRYEAMLLMGLEDSIETELGRWSISTDNCRVVLATGGLR